MKHSATIMPALLPNEAQVRTYEERGWYVSPVILSEEIIESARADANDYHLGHRDSILPNMAGFTDWKPGDGDGVRNNEFVSLQNERIRKLSLQTIIGAIAARLARTRQIRLFDDQLVYKPPVREGINTVVGWHTDSAYWSTCTSESMLTAWVPFDDSEERSGTLLVIDGSHRWPGTDHLRGFHSQDLGAIEQKLGRPVNLVPMQLKKGQVSFHHSRTVHGSSPNETQNPRYALAVHLQDEHNHYHDFLDTAGNAIELPHDRLCRRLSNGAPDYADPAVFPILWEG